MKALITASGQFGPFTSITKGTDRWHCDGADYPFNVIGEATIGEYVAPPPPTPDPSIAILAQIAALEATVTQRRLREATLGNDNGWLANVDAQIATLRASL